MSLKELTDRIGQMRSLDSTAIAIQEKLEAAYGLFGDRSRDVKDLVHGTWLGHNIHPPITDVPVGAWSASVTLDLLEIATGRDDLAPGADMAIVIGLLGGVAASWTGWTDWDGNAKGHEERRIGLVHGLLNVGAASLFAGSLLLRRAGRRGTGQIVGFLGYGAVVASSYLGGELVFNKQLGVNRAPIPSGPEEYTPISMIGDLEDNVPYRFNVEGESMVVVKSGYYVTALSDTCSHLGISLAGGTVEDGCIICPAHSSTFDLHDGSVVHGPATNGQPRYDVRVVDEQIEVKMAPPPA